MKYKITIPEPCHEDWNTMTPTERGRFCAMCRKEVLDFTQFTDKELIHRLDTNKKMCGRFREDQLNVDLHSMETISLPYKKWWLSAASIFTLGILGEAQEIETISKSKVEQIENKSIVSKTDSLKTYQGIVVDVDGFPVVDAYVYLVRDKDNGKYTDENGAFEIEGFENDTINTEFIGFETKTISLSEVRKEEFIEIEFKGGLTTGLTVIVYERCGFFQRVLNLFRSRENKRCFRQKNH